jgi:hypothetical protein
VIHNAPRRERRKRSLALGARCLEVIMQASNPAEANVHDPSLRAIATRDGVAGVLGGRRAQRKTPRRGLKIRTRNCRSGVNEERCADLDLHNISQKATFARGFATKASSKFQS